MEFRVIESEAIEMVVDSINELVDAVCSEVNSIKEKQDKEWVDTSELASILGISIKTIQNYKRRGLIGYSSLSHKSYFKVSEVMKIL